MTRAFLTALILGVALTTAAAQTKEIAITLRNQRDAATLRGLGLDVAGRWPELRAYGDARTLETLQQSGLTAEVLHHDIERFYASRLQVGGAHFSIAPTFGQGSMGGYFTFNEVVLAMDSLQAQYPALIQPKVQLGLSHEGRAIWMWKLSDNPTTAEAEPRVLIDGGHHGREPISVHACVWLAKTLCEGYGSDPQSTEILDKRELFLIPVVNPDGYAHNEVTAPNGGGMWRKNRRPNADGSFGVDPNRNYAYQWGLDNFGSSPVMSAPTYRGPAPFSEPCTDAIRVFASGAGLSAAFTLHSFGGMVLVPPSYTFSPAATGTVSTIYQTYASEMAALGPGYATGFAAPLLGYVANGTAQDWYDGALQTFAFGAELGTAADGFWPPTSRIIPICEDAKAYLSHVIKIAGSDPRIDDVTVTETAGATPNGTWEPGETLEVVALLRNGGLAADTFSVSLESTSPWVTISGMPSSAGTIASNGGTGSNAGAPLQLTIAPSAPTGQLVAFDVVAVSPSGVRTRTTVAQPIGLPVVNVVSESFENGPGGWTVDHQVSSGGDWTLADPIGTTFAGQAWNPEDDHTTTGTHCWFTGQVPPSGGTHASNDVDGITTLTSPRLDASSLQSPEISFWRWFAASNVGDPRMEVELSNDGGATWVPVMTIATNQPGWIEENILIEEHLPRTDDMRIRFRVIDYPNLDVTEAAIDDFRLHGFQSAVDVSLSPPPVIGGTSSISVNAPHFVGQEYLLGVARTARVGIPVGIGLVPLDLDDLFGLVSSYPSVFVNFTGNLDTQGAANAQLVLPNVPSLSGLEFLLSGVTISPLPVPAVTGIAGAHRFVIQ